jgi:hypothetical protein
MLLIDGRIELGSQACTSIVDVLHEIRTMAHTPTALRSGNLDGKAGGEEELRLQRTVIVELSGDHVRIACGAQPMQTIQFPLFRQE